VRDARGAYRPSSKLFRLATAYPPFRDLMSRAIAPMQQFADATSEGRTPRRAERRPALRRKAAVFGSKHPVCLVAAKYARVLGVVAGFILKLSANEQEQVLGGDAVSFYGLTPG
jgi:hypothetical protein